MSYLIGIDKGTSVIKTVVFDATGRDCGSAQCRVDALHPKQGWHEEDPDKTWAHCVETIVGAMKSAGVTGADIKGIGITAHMGGAWIVGEDGRHLRNAICWPDARAQKLQMALERSGVLDKAFDISGNGMMPGITVMLLAWLSKNEPDLVEKAAAVLCAKDYLRFCLTGELATDPSDVSFVPGDIAHRVHSSELMKMCGAADWVNKMPVIIESGEIAGRITKAAAKITGLAVGTPVITGLGDACANAIGVGCINKGDALTVLGTSCLNSQILSSDERAPQGLGFLFSMPLGRYVRILPNTSGTMTMDWFLNQFGGPRAPSGEWDFDELENLATAAGIGAGGVILLPYINGSGVLAPFFDAQARGAFFGLSSQTNRDHLLRAVYEGVCFATRDCFEAMPNMPTSIMLTGGGARSLFWAQMFADICGVPTEISDSVESGALGVALLSGVATGVWPDIDTAIGATVKVAKRFVPNSAAHAEYNGWFDLYRDARDVYQRHSTARAALVGGDIPT